MRRLGASSLPWPREGSVSSGKHPVHPSFFGGGAAGARNCHTLSGGPATSCGTIVHATPRTPCAHVNETEKGGPLTGAGLTAAASTRGRASDARVSCGTPSPVRKNAERRFFFSAHPFPAAACRIDYEYCEASIPAAS